MTRMYSDFGLSRLISLLFETARAQSSREPVLRPNDDRSDRAFLLDMMICNPEALQSDQGMLMLMALHPSQT